MSICTTNFSQVHSISRVRPYEKAVSFLCGGEPSDEVVIDSSRQNLDMLERAVAMMRAHMPREHTPSMGVLEAEGVSNG